MMVNTSTRGHLQKEESALLDPTRKLNSQEALDILFLGLKAFYGRKFLELSVNFITNILLYSARKGLWSPHNSAIPQGRQITK